MALLETTEENFLYSAKRGLEKKIIEAYALEICKNKHKKNIASIGEEKEQVAQYERPHYVVNVPRPKKNEFALENNILKEYITSVLFFIAFDLKDPTNTDCDSKVEDALKLMFAGQSSLPPHNRKIYLRKRNENMTRKEFLEFVDRFIKFLRQENFIKNEPVVFNYVTDYCQDHSEFFKNANIETLKKETIHSNFIFVKNLVNKSKEVKMEEENVEEEEIEEEEIEEEIEEEEIEEEIEEEEIEEEEIEEEEIEEEVDEEEEEEKRVIEIVRDIQQEEKEILEILSSAEEEIFGILPSDEKNTAPAYRRPFSPNRSVPALMKHFIEFRNCFFNKSLNFPSLYVLKNEIELHSFFLNIFMNSENYYYASFPEKLSSNVSGYRLAEDGSFSREVKEFNFDDFILFKKENFENLKITLRDAIGNAKAETGVIKIIKYYSFPPFAKRMWDSAAVLKEFVLSMNKQWIGEIYLLNKGHDHDVINRSIDLVFDIYSNLYKNLENASVFGGIEKKKRGIDGSSSSSSSSSSTAGIMEKSYWENPTFRKKKAKKLLLLLLPLPPHSPSKKSLDAYLNLISELTNLKGSIKY
nr:MAG: hypothetical protein [Porcellio scaber clopovirus]